MVASHLTPGRGVSAIDYTCTMGVNISTPVTELGVITSFFTFRLIVMYVSALKIEIMHGYLCFYLKFI